MAPHSEANGFSNRPALSSRAPALPPERPSCYSGGNQSAASASALAGACAGCGGRLGQEWTTALGQTWHPSCFLCAGCHKPIGDSKFVQNGARAFHSKCYVQLHGDRCRGCGLAIDGRYVKTDTGDKYHEQCFRCQNCGTSLRGGYVLILGVPHCGECRTNAAAANVAAPATQPRQQQQQPQQPQPQQPQPQQPQPQQPPSAPEQAGVDAEMDARVDAALVACDVSSLSVAELKRLLARARLSADGCLDKEELRGRAREAVAQLSAPPVAAPAPLSEAPPAQPARPATGSAQPRHATPPRQAVPSAAVVEGGGEADGRRWQDGDGDGGNGGRHAVWWCAFCRAAHRAEQHFCDHCAKIRNRDAEPTAAEMQAAPEVEATAAAPPAAAVPAVPGASAARGAPAAARSGNVARSSSFSRRKLQAAREQDAELGSDAERSPAVARARQEAQGACGAAAAKRAFAEQAMAAEAAARDEAQRAADAAKVAADAAAGAVAARLAAVSAAEEAEAAADEAEAALSAALLEAERASMHPRQTRRPPLAPAAAPGMASPVAEAAAAPAAGSGKTAVERVQALNELRDAGLIDDGEYRDKKAAILDAL